MISIIIPTLNEEKIIERTLASLISHLTIPYEIIVSDGKSKDKTVEIARKYNSQIVLYTEEKRQTIAGGRNDGAKVAKGDFLVFFDADCSLKNADDFFTKAIARFKDNPTLVALAPTIRVLPESEHFSDKLVFGYLNIYFRIMNNFFHKGQAAGELQMIRRETFEKVGGYREDLVAGEDMEMFLRLSKIGKTFLAKDLTVFHTGRRIRKIGWPRLLWTWFKNTASIALLNKSVTKEWVPVR